MSEPDMQRFASLVLHLMPTITEQELKTLRAGDRVLLPVEFMGMRRSGSVNYGIEKDIAILKIKQIECIDRVLMPKDVEVEVFGAQIHSVHKATPEAGDVVRWHDHRTSDTLYGRIVAVDEGDAMVRQIRPVRRVIVPVDKLKRALKPKDLTPEEIEVLK
jgi:hypothetical protein